MSPTVAGGAPRGGVRVLEDRVINQIAAGEVVERPASVVKELVENALDAGARHVRVTLRAGGRDLVQVEDDGEGMNRQDAMLCVERHATSKIRDSSDLAVFRTLGFRGEALPSIAAVSRFELLTRRPVDEVGTRVVIDAGRMVDVRDAGCPPGTRISVRNLFANLPARRKFLRTVPTELSHCQDMVIRQTLIREGLGLELFHDGRALVRLPAGASAPERAAVLLGRNAERLVAVDWSDEVAGGIAVSGLVSPPGVHHPSSRGSLWLYVNGRAVRDPLMRRAVLDAFRHVVPRGRYPTVVLDLRMRPEEVDVNVHPAKTEVRFRSGRDVARALTEGLRSALADKGIQSPTALRPVRGGRAPRPAAAGQVVLPGVAPVSERSAGGGEGRRGDEDHRARFVGEGSAAWSPPPEGDGRRPTPPPPPPPPAAAVPPAVPDHGGAPPAVPDHGGAPPAVPDHGGAPPADRRAGEAPAGPAPISGPAAPASPSDPVAPAPTLVGQLADRWLLCEYKGGLLIVDQHRAHARRIARGLAAAPPAVPLLAPVLVELAAEEVAALVSHQDMLAAFGVEVEGFGGDTVRLRALPAACGRADPVSLVRQLAAALRSGGDAEAVRELLARAGAIPAGRSLSAYEQRSLLADIDPLAPGVSAWLDPDEIARRTGG